MRQIHRLTDPNTAGAPVVSIPQGTVYSNNLLVAVDGSQVQGHGLGIHSSPNTTGGSPNVFINNIPVNRTGDSDTCGHSRASGSPNVFVN